MINIGQVSGRWHGLKNGKETRVDAMRRKAREEREEEERLKEAWNKLVSRSNAPKPCVTERCDDTYSNYWFGGARQGETYRICDNCGAQFYPRSRNQKYCGTCRNSH